MHAVHVRGSALGQRGGIYMYRYIVPMNIMYYLVCTRYLYKCTCTNEYALSYCMSVLCREGKAEDRSESRAVYEVYLVVCLCVRARA